MGIVNQNQISKLQNKGFTGTQAEFATVLQTLLLRHPIESESDKVLLEGVGLSAGVDEGIITVCMAHIPLRQPVCRANLGWK